MNCWSVLIKIWFTAFDSYQETLSTIPENKHTETDCLPPWSRHKNPSSVYFFREIWIIVTTLPWTARPEKKYRLFYTKSFIIILIGFEAISPDADSWGEACLQPNFQKNNEVILLSNKILGGTIVKNWLCNYSPLITQLGTNNIQPQTETSKSALIREEILAIMTFEEKNC